MRIAQVVCTFPPYHGGMGNIVYQTASELAKFGHEIEVITPHYYREEELEIDKDSEPTFVKEQKITERELDVVARRLKPALQKGNAAYIPQIQHELDNFDLVHLHYPFYGVANLVRKWKVRNPQKPLVVTYHMDNRAPGWLGLFFKYYAKYWMPKILNTADVLIASSLDYIENSQAREIYLQNPNKWIEVPFGVDIERFRPRDKSASLFSRHNLNPDLPVLLFVGGMDRAHYFKGIPVLLQALHELKTHDFILQTLLVGDGELRQEYEMQAKVLGLSDFVKFAGQVSQEELPYYYNLADLFVLPSTTKGEAFGMVLLEAMASGVPVVASDLPGVRTVASEGGMVFASGSHLLLAETLFGYFKEDVDQWQWTQDVRQTAEERYSLELMGERLNSIYQQLV
ncbi:MAG TPA: hypothetical protein DEB09_02395 [Candidatus Magasanikbacteria bacterium]|nr:hypothetical protein [Candidatus Magasanikbacteria bacterium]